MVQNLDHSHMQREQLLQRVSTTVYSPLTLAGRVEQCCLETDSAHVLEALVNGYVDSVAMVRIYIGQGEQVSRPNKEVAMERVQTQT